MTRFDSLSKHDLARLRAANPVPVSASRDAEQALLSGIRTGVMCQIEQPTPTPVPTPARTRRHVSGSRWGWRAAIGAAAVVAVAATVILTHQGTAQADPALAVPLPFTTGSHASAAAFLNHAAAALDKSTEGSSGSVRYTSIQSYAPQTSVRHHKVTTTVGTTVFDIWYAPNGATQVEEYSQAQDMAGGDVGGPAPVKDADHTGWANWPDPNRGMSGDPAAARTQVGQQIDNWSTSTAAEQSLDLQIEILYNLQAGTATNAQTAAYYRILASTPGVFDAGPVTDRLGRPGHAVGVPNPGQEAGNTAARYVIIEPMTGRVLQTENDMAHPPSALKMPDRPWVDEYHVIRDSRMVSSLGAR